MPPAWLGRAPMLILLAMHGLWRERRKADGDVLGPFFTGSAIANSFAWQGNDGLARANFVYPAGQFDAHHPALDDRDFLKLGLLRRLLPAGETMRAMLTFSWPVVTRPTNSSIRLGLLPAAVTMLGLAMSLGMVRLPSEIFGRTNHWRICCGTPLVSPSRSRVCL